MTLYISVINHNHDDIICQSETLKNLAEKHVVVIRSNTTPTDKLNQYVNCANIHLVVGKKQLGFAANNNAVFQFCSTALKMKKKDYFLALNPDVDIEIDAINDLLIYASELKSDISTINLFRDPDFIEYDNSIRYYHKISAPFLSLMGFKRNDIYNKDKVDKPINIDWAAGSFLLFRVEAYSKLSGFDEKYFMYFEDADICTRANREGMVVTYIPTVKAVHYASLKNRALFSKHFFWYTMSAFRYHFKNWRLGITD